MKRKYKEGRYNSRSGSNHFRWKGGIAKHSEGYLLERKRGHQRANKAGYVPQHVLVMEKDLGRFLNENEEVHHVNHIKNDNRIENLKLCKNSEEHRRYDSGWWKLEDKWWKKCNWCKLRLEVNEKNFYLSKDGKWHSRFCKKCSNTQSRKRYYEKKDKILSARAL